VLKVLFQEQEVLLMKQKANTYFGIMMSRKCRVLHVFSVKPFLWLWYNRFFSNGKICYYDQTSADFDKISEVFPYYQIVAAGNSRNSTNPQVAAKAALICLLVVLF
jgi:hypothetical protein